MVAQYERQVSPRTSLGYYEDDDARLDATGRVVGRKPTESYLNALLRQGWNEQLAQRGVDDEMEQLLQDQHELDLPDLGIESERFTGSRAMEVVLQISQFWPTRPQITIPPLGSGEDYEGFSDDLETALNALIAALEKAVRGPRGPFWDSVRKQVAAYGRAFGVLLPNPRTWRDYPHPTGELSPGNANYARDYLKQVDKYAKGKLPPLRLECIPSRRVMPFFDGDGLAECFWITMDRAWEVVQRCKATGRGAHRFTRWVEENPDDRLAQRVPVIHYANRTWCAELVGTPKSFPPEEERTDWIEDCDLLGEPYPHWLEDRIPVAYFSGLTTPLTEDHKAVVGVAYQVRNLIYGLDRLDSMKGTAVRTWAWPTPILKTSLVRAELIEAGDDGRPRPLEIAPGMTLTLWGDEDLSFLTYQGDGPDTELMIQRLEQRFQQLTLPSAESQSSDVSGYLYAQMRKAVKGKWGSISDGLARGWEDLTWVALEYLRRMPGPVYIPAVDEIGWADMGLFGDSRDRRRGTVVRLDPAKLREYNPFIHVVVEEDKSLDMVANAQTALALLQAGVPEAMVYQNVLGIQNYKQVRIMKWLQKLDQFDPYIQEVLGAAVEAGNLHIADQTAQAAGGIDPSRMAPGQVAAMIQAGMIDPATVPPELMQMVQMMMQQGAVGAMSQGGVPPQMLPQATTPMPGMAGPLPPGGGAGMPPMGGAPSPAASPLPPAPRPVGLPGGRAPGQSRLPGGPRRA